MDYEFWEYCLIIIIFCPNLAFTFPLRSLERCLFRIHCLRCLRAFLLKISGLTIIRSETFKMLKEMRMENRFIYNQVLLRIGTMSESFMG